MASIQQAHPNPAGTGPRDHGGGAPFPARGDPSVPNDVHPEEGEEPDLPDYEEEPAVEGGDEAAR